MDESEKSYIVVMTEVPLASSQDNPGHEIGRQGSPNQLARSSLSGLPLKNSFFTSIILSTETKGREKIKVLKPINS